jgi:hypothetical protein
LARFGWGATPDRHDLNDRIGWPVKRMRMNIPLSNKCLQSRWPCAVLSAKSAMRRRLRCKMRAPLLDLIHPGAMHWGMVKYKAQVQLLPMPALFFPCASSDYLVHGGVNNPPAVKPKLLGGLREICIKRLADYF